MTVSFVYKQNTLESVKKVGNFLRKWQTSPLNNYKVTNSWIEKFSGYTLNM